MRRKSLGSARTRANKFSDFRRSHLAAQKELICPKCNMSLGDAPEMDAGTLLALQADKNKIPQRCPRCKNS